MSSTTMNCTMSLPKVATSSTVKRTRVSGLNKLSARSASRSSTRFAIRAEATSDEPKDTAWRREGKTTKEEPPSPLAPAVVRKYSDLMAFGGVAPELINGRVCMGAFVAAVGAELATHETVAQQFADAPMQCLAFFSVIYMASFAPNLRGDDMNPANDYGKFWQRYPGMFQKDLTTPGAMTREEHAQLKSPYTTPSIIEMWNGRAAMLGLTALVATEAMTHTSFF